MRVVVVGCGNMGSSHARAYTQLQGFDLVGLLDRSKERAQKLSTELGNVPLYSSLKEAVASSRADAVAICTYPETHYELTLQSLLAGLHVFVEKPIAGTVREAEEIALLAEEKKNKVVVGYILRHHPAWQRFVEEARQLGAPLVMRMNLNQQSSGSEWEVHKSLMRSMSPIVDCGVHYVDIMCQMTRSKPLRVQAIGARLSDEIDKAMYNYGQLQLVFENGSVGWYEAGWGPMMSEVAYFVKDVIGPLGCISMAEPQAAKEGGSADIDSHTKTSRLIKHDAASGKNIVIDCSDEPNHQELCNREQAYFLRSIRHNLDLREHLADAVNSLRIVLAADESVKTGNIIHLP
ncbi:MAG: gfo/Idh/MocA family oxidoreductase [Bacteroidetes bacterium]|nr:gfo/Idh/MocA family oxidoreductase [Bacteroidota bacterium]MBM2844760.1 gfo/Idh/MocA family oxidoreductase [Bacteroidota bacterium]